MARAVALFAYPTASDAALVVREAGLPVSQPPRLLDRVRQAIRARHYSRQTGKAYVAWTRRYIYTHVLNQGPAGVRSPADGLGL